MGTTHNNIKIDWNIEDSLLRVEMVFPYVGLRSKPPHKTGHPISSSIIINNALRKHLKRTTIRHTNSSSVGKLKSQTLYLTIGLTEKDTNCKLSLKNLNDRLILINETVLKEIDELINPKPENV